MNRIVGIGLIKTATGSLGSEFNSHAPIRGNDTTTNPVPNYVFKANFKAKIR